VWKLVQRLVIHPRDSQKREPFAEVVFQPRRDDSRMSGAAELQLGML